MQNLIIGRDRTIKLFNKHWQHCVGSGHAKMAMRSDYARQLKRAHDELGVERVRFHGIFCDDMHTVVGFDEVIPFPGAEKITERSFFHCGVAIDNVLAAGVKPFVELSFMPNPLAKERNDGSKMFYGANFSQPEDFDAWAEHVGAYVEYLIHRYGKEEVETWYFEVWNEPDLVGAFFRGTQEDYFRLYEITVRKIKSIDEKLMVGGPATSGSRWVDDFVAFCESNDVPLDFVTTHQYAGDPLTGVKEPGAKEEATEDGFEKFNQLTQMVANLPKDLTHLQLMRTMMGDPSEGDDFPEGRFKANAAVVRQQAKDYPVFYTEWNFQAVLTCYHNDTRKASAYLVKTALDVEPYMQGSSVWTFSDIFEELHQFTDEFHGGFGLQTIHGIPKPNFYALKMMGMLAKNRVDLGTDSTDKEIGVAAFEDEEKFQVLLFRQKMKQDDLPAERIDVSVALDGLKGATLYRIDEQHCNPLKVFEEMGSPRDLTPAQVAEIENCSSLKPERIDLAYKDGYVSFAAELGVNDIYLINIEKECAK